jgi:hypothetical protein
LAAPGDAGREFGQRGGSLFWTQLTSLKPVQDTAALRGQSLLGLDLGLGRGVAKGDEERVDAVADSRVGEPKRGLHIPDHAARTEKYVEEAPLLWIERAKAAAALEVALDPQVAGTAGQLCDLQGL